MALRPSTCSWGVSPLVDCGDTWTRPRIFLFFSPAMALNGNLALTTLSSFTALVYKISFPLRFFLDSTPPGSRLSQAIQKRRHHLTTFLGFTFQSRNDLSVSALTGRKHTWRRHTPSFTSLLFRVACKICMKRFQRYGKRFFFAKQGKAVEREHWHGGMLFLPLLERLCSTTLLWTWGLLAA